MRKLIKKILAVSQNDNGTTLIELILTMVLTLVVVSVIPPLLSATTDAASTSQQIAYGTSSAEVAIQQIDNYLASATLVCPQSIPVTWGTYSAQAGYALMVESDAFNGPSNPEWVEWIIPTNGTQPSILYTRTWPNNVSGNTPPAGLQFTPLAQPIYNYIDPVVTPFTITPGNQAQGQPEVLNINLWVGAGNHSVPQSHPIDMTNRVAALDTGFSSTGVVPSC